MAGVPEAVGRLTDGVNALKKVVLDAQQSGVEDATLDSVVELVALRTSSLFESFLEELFYLCMLSSHTDASVAPVLPVSSRAEADLLIYSGGKRRENYLTWLPFDATVDRADAYLDRGAPFTWLRYRQVEMSAIKELTVVRNAVAHPSAYASRLLEQLVTAKGYLGSRPADYLRSLRTGVWEVLLLLTQVSIIAEALGASSEADADVLLQPEEPFQAGQKAPPGEFECRHCAHARSLSTAAKLGACPQCGVTENCSACGRAKASSTTWKRLIV